MSAPMKVSACLPSAAPAQDESRQPQVQHCQAIRPYFCITEQADQCLLKRIHTTRILWQTCFTEKVVTPRPMQWCTASATALAACHSQCLRQKLPAPPAFRHPCSAHNMQRNAACIASAAETTLPVLQVQAYPGASMPHLTFFYVATPCFPIVRLRPCYGVKQVSLGLLCICISSRSSYFEVKQANQGWSSLRVCSAHHCGAL